MFSLIICNSHTNDRVWLIQIPQDYIYASHIYSFLFKYIYRHVCEILKSFELTDTSKSRTLNVSTRASIEEMNPPRSFTISCLHIITVMFISKQVKPLWFSQSIGTINYHKIPEIARFLKPFVCEMTTSHIRGRMSPTGSRVNDFASPFNSRSFSS